MNYTITRNEASFTVLFRLNPHPRWILDSRTLRFLEVNEAAEKAYGYTREEFFNLTLENLCVVEDLPNLYHIQESQFDEPNSYYKEAIHKLKNGDLVYREVVSYKVDFEGKQARLALINDITERRRIETQLNKYITQLEELAFYNSHRLRKPVNELISLTKNLQLPQSETVATEIKERVLELNQLIHEMNQKLNDPKFFEKTLI